ncbi:MAG: SurA N-terminal domain-containing protein [Endozoicomonas sp.]
MLQSMRDKAKSWVTFVIVGIIAFMMAITGLETLSPNPNNPDVATVNGQDITRAQLAQAIEQQRRMLIQQMGDQFDPALIDEKVLRENVLNSLIDRSLLLQQAKSGRMDVGTDALDKMIVSMQEFQQDGRFNQDRFQMMVRNFGMTPLQFRTLLREETLLTQVQSGVAGSEFVTADELKKLNALENQSRDIAWMTLDAASVRDSIQPAADQISEYYEANGDRYMTPEQVIIRYVIMEKGSVVNTIVVDDSDVQDEFYRRIEDLKETASDRQSVSTILIETGETRSQQEARERADEVLAKLKAGGTFTDLAKEYSDDPVTAGNGGSMGMVEPGFFGDDFDNAVAALEVGQVSEPVVTDYGLQVLRLDSREEVTLPTLADLKDEIVADLRDREASVLFLDRSRQLADISFEASDLAQPAEQLGLKVMTSEPFGRNGGTDITADPKVVAAAFSDDVIELGANSELIELTPEKVMVLRVGKHMRPEPEPLEDVRESLVQSIKLEEARKLMQARADKLLAELSDGANAAELASSESLAWTESLKATRAQQGVPAQLLAQAFRMKHPEGESPVFGRTELANGDVALIALKGVYPGEATTVDAARNRMLGAYIASGTGRNLFGEYLRSLKDGAKVKLNIDEE